MALNSHNDRKFRASSRLVSSVAFPNLLIEHRALTPARHESVTFESNEVSVLLAGRSFSSLAGNGVYRQAIIQPGMLRIKPVGTYETDSEIKSPVETLHIYLPPGLIEHSALADYDIDPAKTELAYTEFLWDPVLQRIAMGLHGILGREAEPTDRLYADGLRVALAGHLLGTYAIDRWQPPARTPEFDLKRLARVIDFIEAHFAEDITLARLAAESRLSEFHFSRLFRGATGVSPHRYVTMRRVQEAQNRLEHDQFSMVEIALETGFGSQANFIRVFRKSTGLTPGQYRDLHRR